MSKQVLIVMLVGMNLFLLACVLLTAYSPPLALAEAVENSSNDYILITAEADKSNDAIYLIDVKNQRMHAFAAPIPTMAGQRAQARYFHSRDLEQDFPQHRGRR